MKGKDVWYFLLCLAVPLLVGGIAGYAIMEPINGWYAELNKPSFNPPNAVFGPVWTTLYILMGVSLFIVIRQPASHRRSTAILVFGLQLFLNFWWSIFFFNFQRPDIALMEIAVLWLCILWMIMAFYRVKPAAAYLQIPYILWVSFASVLNWYIWRLN